jgi:MFS superfamily sulfate permease-like transporter
VTVFAASKLIDPGQWRSLARSSKAEAAIAVTTAAFVITIGVLQAIIVAVVLSVADIIRRAARPADAVLGWSVKDDRYVDVSDHPDAGITSGVVVYRIQDRLFFANATSSNAGLRRYPAWMPCSGNRTRTLAWESERNKPSWRLSCQLVCPAVAALRRS